MGRGVETMLRIIVVGAGAMGAMFGARFREAGAEVVLYDIDRAHIGAIRAHGLRLSAPDREHRFEIEAASEEAEIGSANFALIMVGSNATEDAARIAAAVLGPDGFALTL